MEQSDIERELDTAYRMISAIPVCGDAVDLLAQARASLRRASMLSRKRGGDDASAKPAP